MNRPLPTALVKCCENRPLARDISQFVDSSIFKRQTGSGDEISDCGGDEHLSCVGQTCHAGTDVHTDPRDIITDLLDLARMDAGPEFEPELADFPNDRLGALNGSGGTIERGKKAVAPGAHLDTAVASQVRSDDLVMILENRSPALVAQLGGAPCRTDDIGE